MFTDAEYQAIADEANVRIAAFFVSFALDATPPVVTPGMARAVIGSYCTLHGHTPLTAAQRAQRRMARKPGVKIPPSNSAEPVIPPTAPEEPARKKMTMSESALAARRNALEKARLARAAKLAAKGDDEGKRPAQLGIESAIRAALHKLAEDGVMCTAKRWNEARPPELPDMNGVLQQFKLGGLKELAAWADLKFMPAWKQEELAAVKVNGRQTMHNDDDD